MSWKIAPVERRVFSRNTIEVVVCQLRFNPILKVEQKIADFQEIVRAKYPNFSITPIKNIVFSKSDQVEVTEEKQFLFKKETSEDSIFLTTDSIAFETKKYTERADFLSDVKLGLDALSAVHGNVSPKRLGVRFINSIKKDQVESFAKRSVNWSDLIKDGFLNVPENLYDLADSAFLNEVTSACALGKLTLRYGILPTPKTTPSFRFDSDRYVDEQFEMSKYEEILKTFTNDTFALFSQILKPLIIEWMEKSNGP